jgi:hypothetical protein
MNPLKYLEKRIRGWLPKELTLPRNQRTRMVDHLTRLQLLRLAYGVMLGALLVTPFGVYHSRVEPYIMGYLWGYNLPIGYIGVLLGIAVFLYPRLNALRSLRFSLFMPCIGLFLLLTFFFSPKDYFINLFNATNFSSVQIDVDFAVGNSAVLGLSLLSIAFGLVTFIRGWLPKKPSIPSNQRTKMAEINQKDMQRKIFKISIVANAIMLGTFLGLHSLIDPFNKNIEYAVISWIIFVLTLVSVDFSLYRYSKRKTNNQVETLQQ